MRLALDWIAWAALTITLPVQAQTVSGTVETAEENGTATHVIAVKGCKIFAPGVSANAVRRGGLAYLTAETNWSGACSAEGLADGTGVFQLCYSYGGQQGCTVYEGTVRNGLLQGRVVEKFLVREGGAMVKNPLSPDTVSEYRNGCRGSETCDPASALRLQARYLAAGGSRQPAPVSPTMSGASTPAKASGSPGYVYDDDEHGQCVTVEGLAPRSGREMAYGRYKLINKCAYPVKLRTCITPDRADGTPSPNFDSHQDGALCPGSGWGGTSLGANEMREDRAWYEYRRIKWEIMICREGWDFVGADGKSFPTDIIGSSYGCRKYSS